MEIPIFHRNKKKGTEEKRKFFHINDNTTDKTTRTTFSLAESTSCRHVVNCELQPQS